MNIGAQGGQPVSGAVPRPQPRPDVQIEYDTVTVVQGDNLWNIAKRELGEGMAWTRIYDLNREVIGENPDLIHPGMELKVRARVTSLESTESNEITAPAEATDNESAPLSTAPSLQDEVVQTPSGQAETHIALVDVPDPEEAVAGPAVSDTPPELAPAPLPASPPDIEAAPVPTPEAAPAPEAVETVPAAAPAPESEPAPEAETEIEAEIEAEPETEPETLDAAPPTAPTEAEIAARATLQQAEDILAQYSQNPDDPAARQGLREFVGSPEFATLPDGIKPTLQEALQQLDGVEAAEAEVQAQAQAQTLANDRAQTLLQAHAQHPQDLGIQSQVQSFAASDAVELLSPDNQAALQSALAQIEATQQARQSAQQILSAYAEAPDDAQTRSALKDFVATPEFALLGADLQGEFQAASARIAGAEAAEAEAARIERAQTQGAALLEAHQASPQNPQTRSALSRFAESEPFALLRPEQQEQIHNAVEQIQREDALNEKAQTLLERVDGRGYSAAHHGDPVGGIPAVVDAMDEILALKNSGELAQVSDPQTRQKLAAWSREIVNARIQSATQRWGGAHADAAQTLNTHLNSAAFAALDVGAQERLIQDLRPAYDIAQSMAARRAPGPEQAALIETLTPLMTRVPPTAEYVAEQRATALLQAYQAQPTQTEARQALKDYRQSEDFPLATVETRSAVETALGEISEAERAEAVANARQQGRALLAAYAAQPEHSETRSAIVDFARGGAVARVEPELKAELQAVATQIQQEDRREAQARQLLGAVDGQGYSVRHHGDPVGGIAQVVEAMDDLVEMYNRGESEQLKSPEDRARVERWAQDVVEVRSSTLAQNWSPFDSQQTEDLLERMASPAFQSLSSERQDRALEPALTAYQILRQESNPSPEQREILQALQPHMDRISPPEPTPQERAQERVQSALTAYQESGAAPEIREQLLALHGDDDFQLLTPELQETLSAAVHKIRAQERQRAQDAAQGQAQQLLSAYDAQPHDAQAREALQDFVASESFALVQGAPKGCLLEAASQIGTEDAREARAAEALAQLEGGHYNLRIHGDPVGGIPAVVSALESALELVDSGEVAELYSEQSQERIRYWAGEARAASIERAARGWLGYRDEANQELLEQLQSPSFAQLPAQQRDRALSQLRSGYEQLREMQGAGESLNASQSALYQVLQPDLDRLYPPPPTPVELAQARGQELLSQYHGAQGDEQTQALESLKDFAQRPDFALQPSEQQTQIQTLLESVAAQERARATQSAREQGQALLQAFHEAPHSVDAQSALRALRTDSERFVLLDDALRTEISTAVAEMELQATRQAQAEELLAQIEGRGYSIAHHGDPVGGLSHVAHAMSDIVDLVNRGDQHSLAPDTRHALERWAGEIAATRLQPALQSWDPWTPGASEALLAQIDAPAFQTLSPEVQAHKLRPLQSQLALHGEYIEPDNEAAMTLLRRYHQEAAAQALSSGPEAEALPEDAPSEVATQSPEFEALQATLTRRRSQGFSRRDKAEAVAQQALALWQQQPQERLALAQSLEEHNYPETLHEILAQAQAEDLRTLLTDARFDAVKLLEQASNPVAGQILTRLATVANPAVEQILADTVEAYSGTLWDREKPFEILADTPAFDNLSPELREKIQDLISFW